MHAHIYLSSYIPIYISYLGGKCTDRSNIYMYIYIYIWICI